MNKRLNTLSSELKQILEKNFRDNEKIDTILLEIFSNKFFVNSLLVKHYMYKRLSKYPMNKSSFENLLKCSQSDKIDLLKNNIVRDHALFIIVKSNTESFYDFFVKYTLKHYGYMIESTILDISPLQHEPRNVTLHSILTQIFNCGKYSINNYDISKLWNRTLSEVLFEGQSERDKFMHQNKRKRRNIMYHLFRSENKDKLEKILFFFVKHGNSDYWKSKTKQDLFL